MIGIALILGTPAVIPGIVTVGSVIAAILAVGIEGEPTLGTLMAGTEGDPKLSALTAGTEGEPILGRLAPGRETDDRPEPMSGTAALGTEPTLGTETEGRLDTAAGFGNEEILGIAPRTELIVPAISVTAAMAEFRLVMKVWKAARAARAPAKGLSAGTTLAGVASSGLLIKSAGIPDPNGELEILGGVGILDAKSVVAGTSDDPVIAETSERTPAGPTCATGMART